VGHGEPFCHDPPRVRRFYSDASHPRLSVIAPVRESQGFRAWFVQVETEAYEQCSNSILGTNVIGYELGGERAQAQTWDTWFSVLQSQHATDPGVYDSQFSPTYEIDLPDGKPNPWNDKE
jgi:hypothetical protein